jgi:integrase
VYQEWLKRDQADNRSVKAVEGRFRKYVLPSWEHRLITDIDRRAALAIIDDIADSGKIVLARRMHGHLHRLFRWAVGRGIIEINPLQAVDMPGSEVSRDRVLDDAELLKVWQAAEHLRPAYRDALRLLVLTGGRRNEISQLRWDEIKDGAIHLEGARTKNGRPHIIPLSEPARRIIDGIEASGDYVFGGSKPITGWPRTKATLDELSGVTGWRLHDIRRTVATGLQRLGVAITVTEAVLGHSGGSRGGIVGVYQRHDYAQEKAAALESWGAHVVAIIKGSERGKVIAYGRR